MIADASVWTKLWDKGVDISAGIITSTVSAGIIAIVGIVTWKIKLSLDLRHDEAKQRQQNRIRKELEGDDGVKREAERLTRLALELQPHIGNFARAASGPDLQIAWSTYYEWLGRNNLQDLQFNHRVIRTWGHTNFQDMVQQNACMLANRIADEVAKTQFKTDSDLLSPAL